VRKSSLGSIVLLYTLRTFTCPSVCFLSTSHSTSAYFSKSQRLQHHPLGRFMSPFCEQNSNWSFSRLPFTSFTTRNSGKTLHWFTPIFHPQNSQYQPNKQLHLKISQACNKITCKQKSFSIQQESIKQNCSYKLQNPSYISRCICCLHYVSLVLRTSRVIA